MTLFNNTNEVPRYGVRCTVQPTAEPVSVSEFKLSQRIDFPDEDAYIAALITAARTHIELVTRKRFVTQTWQLWLDEFPCWEIVLPYSPVQSITSIAYTDTAGNAQTVSAADYVTDLIREPGRITPTWTHIWPITIPQYNAVTVTFVAGYGAPAAVPELAKRAIIMLAAHWYENREPVVVGTNISPLPLTIDAMIQILHMGTYP